MSAFAIGDDRVAIAQKGPHRWLTPFRLAQRAHQHDSDEDDGIGWRIVPRPDVEGRPGTVQKVD